MLLKRAVHSLVFFLAGWPLLVPPGTCVCQVVRADEWPSDPCPPACADEHQHLVSGTPAEHGKSHSGCCDDQDPSRGHNPLGCPANKNTDHSRLLEQYHPPAADTFAIAPRPFSPGHAARLSLHSLPVEAPQAAQPIYLALCTLLV